MTLKKLIGRWPVLRQAAGDPLGLGKAVQSPRTQTIRPRTADAEHVVPSVCPYCAVGCGQLIYVKNGQIIDIEGNPDSPINRGTLCPKGAATFQLLVNPNRWTTVKYRAPYSDHWEDRPLDWAMARIARRVKESRDRTFVERGDDG